jgi:hypothetical protein
MNNLFFPKRKRCYISFKICLLKLVFVYVIILLTIRMSIVLRVLSYERSLFSPLLFGSAWLNTYSLFSLLPFLSFNNNRRSKNVRMMFNVKMIYHQRKKDEGEGRTAISVSGHNQIETIIEWFESMQAHHTLRYTLARHLFTRLLNIL